MVIYNKVNFLFFSLKDEKEIFKKYKRIYSKTPLFGKFIVNLSNKTKEFTIERYSTYFEKFKKELKNKKFENEKLKEFKKRINEIEEIYIFQNICGGSVLRYKNKKIIAINFNLLYNEFCRILAHEIFHFFFHTYKMQRKIKELEANTASFIICNIHPIFWNHISKSRLYDLNLFKEDVKNILKQKWKLRIINLEEYIFLNYFLPTLKNLNKNNVQKFKKIILTKEKYEKFENEYEKEIKIKKFKPIKLNVPIVLWNKKEIKIYDKIYCPINFWIKNY